jgi:hypothetical protein
MPGADPLYQYIVPAVCGLIAGALGSLIAPWVQWGIEQRREKLKYRRNLVEKWRNYIENNFDKGKINDSVLYSELRPHLSKASRDAVEGSTLTIRSGRGGNVVKSLLLDDIKRIEKEWDLI